MFSQFEKDESSRLKSARDTCNKLQEMLEGAKTREGELGRELTRCQAIASLIASE